MSHLLDTSDGLKDWSGAMGQIVEKPRGDLEKVLPREDHPTLACPSTWVMAK